MRLRSAVSSGQRRLYAGLSGAGGVGDYVPPASESVALSSSTDTITRTTDSGGRNLNLRGKISVAMTNITFTGTITGVALEVREQAGQVWQTGATDYTRAYVDRAGGTGPGTAASIPVTLDTVPTHIIFEVYGLGIVAPTMVRARDMTANATDGKWITGQSSGSIAVHDAFRVVFTGTSVDLTGGTMYLVYY